MRHVALVFLVVVVIMVVSTYAEDVCKPGEEKYEDCNHCHCAGGQWGCTRKSCPPKPDVEFNCKPGEKFKKDCNTCTCSADGKNAACTLLAC